MEELWCVTFSWNGSPIAGNNSVGFLYEEFYLPDQKKECDEFILDCEKLKVQKFRLDPKTKEEELPLSFSNSKIIKEKFNINKHCYFDKSSNSYKVRPTIKRKY